MQVLYIEDSSTLRQTVAHGLRQAGYKVTVAATGSEGLDAALALEFDVIILDIMLPDLDGFEILKKLREAKCPAEVLMLTARSSTKDRVAGLDLGADDYLVKPFAFDELLARIRVLVRRRFNQKSNAIVLGQLRIDFSTRQIFWSESELTLRRREFDILSYLALRAGKLVTRPELIEHVYDHAADLKSNAIDSAICNIRKALSDAGCKKMIKTVPRSGYRLEAGAKN